MAKFIKMETVKNYLKSFWQQLISKSIYISLKFKENKNPWENTLFKEKLIHSKLERISLNCISIVPPNKVISLHFPWPTDSLQFCLSLISIDTVLKLHL